MKAAANWDGLMRGLRRNSGGIRHESDGGHSLISRCQQYRFWYPLKLSDKSGVCVFIMLNPATTASGSQKPKGQGARKKCIRFARDRDFGILLICNLFAYRSPDPKGLLVPSDPVGAGNDHYIADVIGRAGKIICAWGDGRRMEKKVDERARQVVAILEEKAASKLYALGPTLTKRGQPRHPARNSMSECIPLQIMDGGTLACRSNDAPFR